MPDEFAALREKNERNTRVQTRYDDLMSEGRHGHYETMFRIVREEIERDRSSRAGKMYATGVQSR